MNSQCSHCPLCMASVTPHLSRVNYHLLPGWWHHPHVTTVTKVVWDSPTQLLLHTDMHEDLHVKCLLFLSNFNQNWSMSTALITFPILNSMKICWEAMECADWHTGRHGKLTGTLLQLQLQICLKRNVSWVFLGSARIVLSVHYNFHIIP